MRHPGVYSPRQTSVRTAFIFALAALVSLLVLLVGERVVRADHAPQPPPHTTSRYMATVDGDILYNEGCAQGSAAEDGRVVLDFGQPWFQNGAYGTILFDGPGTFASVDQIEFAVKRFLAGYWACSPTTTFIYLGTGTNNYGSQVTTGHGEAWANLVIRVQEWIETPPSYASQMTSRGAIDIEMDWNSPSTSRAWVDGYASVPNFRPYYNFGDCGGCPFDYSVTPPPGRSVNNGWTQEDVWYVSWGASPAYPLPEIYRTDGVNAAQWQTLNLYEVVNHGPGSMFFIGAFTQHQACIDRGNPPECQGLDNTPGQGWSQLWHELNSDQRTAQELDPPTDVTWSN